MIATAPAAILEVLAARRLAGPRTMIVVAHPDAETICMGTPACRFRDALLVEVTDGAPRDGRDAALHGYAAIADYAAARLAELDAALEAGQAGAVGTEVIGIPDQEACFNLVTLVEHLLRRLRAEQPAAIFVQPYEGGHPDHDAASFAVRNACRLVEAEGGPLPAIIEMSGYHAADARLATGVFLPADRLVTTIALSSADRVRKRRMIDCFTSQRDLLAPFGTEVERFREAPDYDFTLPPHSSELHYERLGWNISGDVWRRQAQAALDTLGLGVKRWA